MHQGSATPPQTRRRASPHRRIGRPDTTRANSDLQTANYRKHTRGVSRLKGPLRGVPGVHGSSGSVPVVRDLGAYLREQRENAQLSVRQLSKAAGISNPYLSQIERGLRRPSADILQALAKGLEISAESLYVQAGLLDMPDEREAADAVDTRVVIAADPRLTGRQRRILLDLYDSFVESGGAGDTGEPATPTESAEPDEPDEPKASGDEPAAPTNPTDVTDTAAAPRPEQGEHE